MLEQEPGQGVIGEDDLLYRQMQAAYEHFYDVSSEPWTAEEATKLHSDLLARDPDESDIDALLEFFRSPVGRKAIAASSRANREWQEILGRKAQESILVHYREYLAEMAGLTSEYEERNGSRQN